jgi:GNAT superfamily N-acetyltransferase
MCDKDANKLEFRMLDPEDGRTLSDAVDVLAVLGEEYMPTEKLLYHARHHVVIGAFCHDELIGVAVAHPLNSEDFEILERRMGSDRLESLSLPREGRTYTVDALAVKKGYRRMGNGNGPGVGSLLLAEALDRLKDSGCEVILGESWVSGLGDESKNLGSWMEGVEFRFEVPGYWSSDGIPCPVCTSGDCRCSALIFVKTLG